MQNTLFYDDNLQVLRDYNVLFRKASGEAPASQIKAFGDTWQYNVETERTRD